MSKDKLTDYDSTAANNLDVGGISVAEGMLPSGVNNAIREQMSHLADFAAGTSGVDVLKLQDDTDTNSIKLQAPSSVTATTTFTLPDGDGASGQTMITDGAGTLSWAAPYSNRNLIINGAMQVAQRGTSGTSTADIYTTDRFALGHGSPVNAMSWEQSTDAPDNFKNSLKITAGTGASASTTGYGALRQAIEGQNIAHLGFGTSAAKDITLSFWVKCSLTGTFGVSVRNQAGNRAYGGTYSISSANTWEYKTVAIPADTSGTWPTDNGIGLMASWDLGAGSNYDIPAGAWTNGSNMFGVESTVKLTETTGATFYITGVQLEVGETATPFEHRSFGDELRRCQRYYQQISASDRMPVYAGDSSNVFSSSNLLLQSPMRAQPSLSTSGAYSFDEYFVSGRTQSSAHIARATGNEVVVIARFENFSGCTRGNPGAMYNAITKIDAEL